MQTPAAVCVLRGPDHVYELANPRYLALVGNRDVVGKPLRDALPEAAATVVPILDGVFTRGEAFFGDEFPIVLIRDGLPEDCFFNFIYQPLFDASGAVEGIAVVAFEVTDQVRARRRSETLAAELKSTNRDLDQFAYVASHDLKAPLRGIANLSEWLEEALRRQAERRDARARSIFCGGVCTASRRSSTVSSTTRAPGACAQDRAGGRRAAAGRVPRPAGARAAGAHRDRTRHADGAWPNACRCSRSSRT